MAGKHAISACHQSQALNGQEVPIYQGFFASKAFVAEPIYGRGDRRRMAPLRRLLEERDWI
jgi:hypothetical protein